MGGLPELSNLAGRYAQLQAVYAAAGARVDPHALGQVIESREQTLSATARSLGLPACAVTGR